MKLSCHCGNVKITVNQAPETLLSCNCSICHRYGALWGYYAPEEVTVTTESTSTATYRWGDETTDFHHCPNCGCMTHYTNTEKIDTPRVAANFRMIGHKEIETIPIRRFDGSDTWQFIE
ncbi:MAG: aldehyde-activating protein [Chloroflexota bacterium]